MAGMAMAVWYGLLLLVGQPIVLEMAQKLYSKDDPHFTQGLFSGSIIVLGEVQLDLIPPRREAQVLVEDAVEDAPIPDSLRFYSCASCNRLKRVPNQSLQLAEQLYQRRTSQLTTVILTSSRWGMLGCPAAAAGKASEAWLAGPDAIQRALQGLQQPKQLYLLKSSSRATAGRVREKRADASSQQGHVGGHQEQLPQEQQQDTGLSKERPYQQQEQQQPSQQGKQQPGQLPGVLPSTEQQLPCSMPFLQNGPLPATVSYAAQPTVHNQTTYAAARGAYQPRVHTSPPAQQYHPPLGHHPPWQYTHPVPYYGFPPALAGPWGWPAMPPSWGPQGAVAGAAGPWGHPVPMQPLSAAEAPSWLQNFTAAMATAAAAAAAAPTANNSGVHMQQQKKLGRTSRRQQLVTETAGRSPQAGEDYSSDEDWVDQTEGTASKQVQVQKVVYKVLPTPRVRGSRMRVNPALVKQLARRVCAIGLPLWRHVVAVGTAAAGSSNSTVRVRLSPAQIKQAIAEFAAKNASYKAFVELQENRNLPKQLGTLLQLLTVNDDPLIIEDDIVTARILATVRLQNQRATSLNNVLSEARSAFRLLFGRCLLPGITAAASTVKIDGETLRILLQSPVPDGAVTDFSGALQARGSLTREPQGVIRTFEVLQLHLVYGWHVLLRQLKELTKWGSPDFIPARSLDQINRWTLVIQAWLFRGAVDLGRPSDISLYHLGCFQLVLPNGQKTPLAAVALNSLQQGQQQDSMDKVLEAFRAAGAVLEIRVPKSKQCDKKRRRNGGHSIDWVTISKPMLDPALSIVCPTHTVAFCMAASWWARGFIGARLLGVRRFGSNRAAGKRHQQPDFQGNLQPDAYKVPTAGDIHSYTPALYLVHKQAEQQAEQQAASSVDGDESSDEGSCSASEDAEPGSSGESAGSKDQPDYWLSHTKPSSKANAKVLLRLRQLSGYDLRHSLQKDALQTGVPLELSARLASHTTEEAKRYSSNSCYEVSDMAAAPLKLASLEWTPKDPVPIPSNSIDGVPVALDLFSCTASQNAVAAAGTASAADARLSAILGSSNMQRSIRQIEQFISSFANLPDLNAHLHGPVLGKGVTSEVLPVKPLRQIECTTHLRASDSSIADFLKRLPTISAAGLAAPAGCRLVRPELGEVYVSLANGLDQLSAELRGDPAGPQPSTAAGHPKLKLLHYSQVAFGRLDSTWRHAQQIHLQQQQQQAAARVAAGAI